MKYSIMLCLLTLIGCAPDPEIARLSGLLDKVRKENEAMRQVIPSEQPRIVKELEDAQQHLREEIVDNRRLREELEFLKKEAITELQPLSNLLKNLRDRVTKLEQTTSKKGHTHGYFDGKGSFGLQTTEPDH